MTYSKEETLRVEKKLNEKPDAWSGSFWRRMKMQRKHTLDRMPIHYGHSIILERIIATKELVADSATDPIPIPMSPLVPPWLKKPSTLLAALHISAINLLYESLNLFMKTHG